MPVAHRPTPDQNDSLPPMPPVVFVSYCREDAEWLQRFAVMLKPEVRNRPPVQLWHDTLIGAGEQWRAELEDAIARTRVALLLVTPDFLASDFIMNVELPALVAAGAVLVPVLVRACSNWMAVDVLSRVQWARDPERHGPVAALRKRDVDGAIAHATRAVVAALDRRLGGTAARTVADGDGRAQVLLPALVATADFGVLDGVPQLPHEFVAREELLELRHALLGAGEGGLGITGSRGLGIHGQGGIGKTVLAAALARDDDVRGSFPDGVLWVTLGERPDLVGAQIDLLKRLGAPIEGVASTLDGVRALRDALGARRCLGVIDDVWSAAAAQAFDATGAVGRVLYTTRDPATLREVRAAVRRIDVLAPDTARQLLAALTATEVQDLPGDVDRVLEATGRVALALALVAAAVGRGGRGWREVADELQLAAGTFLEHPYASVFKAMGVAVAGLDPRLAAAHETLAVYPEDTRVPVAAVTRLWAHLYQLTTAQTRERLQLLASRELIGLEESALRLHDLQRDFLLLRATSIGLLHHELLEGYRALLPSPQSPWRELPQEEPYIFEHLIAHLAGAGDTHGATTTVTDLGYMAIRTFRHGPHAAESDARRAAALAPADPAIDWVLGLLTQWGHLLTRHAHLSDLAATLLTRATTLPPGVDNDTLRTLLPGRVLTPCWGLPDAHHALRRVLEGHNSGWVRAVAFAPDGAMLASAGLDGSVRLWDVGAATQTAQLEGHRGWVNGTCFAPDGATLASAGSDGSVRLWIVASATQTAQLGACQRSWGSVRCDEDDVVMAIAVRTGEQTMQVQMVCLDELVRDDDVLRRVSASWRGAWSGSPRPRFTAISGGRVSIRSCLSRCSWSPRFVGSRRCARRCGSRRWISRSGASLATA
jgi:hypothetical protein